MEEDRGLYRYGTLAWLSAHLHIFLGMRVAPYQQPSCQRVCWPACCTHLGLPPSGPQNCVLPVSIRIMTGYLLMQPCTFIGIASPLSPMPFVSKRNGV
eukprot:TRINITY_DN96966_c0_g1_i1.p1 TRINITY_DN96966_c0_g1~~TRINITY_DN96966_c0_g1_i1.p1  ORF type:complete len:108 (+),score=11.70 TRINITY_DN96966_c0_g1_i1:31-324(+)